MTQFSPSRDIMEQLVIDGISTALFVGSEPDGPNQSGQDINECITLYDTSLEPPSPKFLIDNVGIQFRSRGIDYNDTFKNLLAVFNKLAGRPAFTINMTRYTGFFPQTSVFLIGRDESNRWLFAFNARVTLEPQADSQYRQAL